MKTYISLAAIVFALVFASSCQTKDTDTTKPTINLIEPSDGTVLVVGEEVHLEMELEDDVQLASYAVDIHLADGHTHKVEAQAWAYKNSWTDIAGKRNTTVHHHEIVVPATVNGAPILPGDYHFMVYLTDAAGNESYTVADVEIAYPAK